MSNSNHVTDSFSLTLLTITFTRAPLSYMRCMKMERLPRMGDCGLEIKSWR